MKKALLVILLVALGFMLGRLCTLQTLEIIDTHTVQSFGQIHEYN